LDLGDYSSRRRRHANIDAETALWNVRLAGSHIGESMKTDTKTLKSGMTVEECDMIPMEFIKKVEDEIEHPHGGTIMMAVWAIMMMTRAIMFVAEEIYSLTLSVDTFGMRKD
jgi:hypothetical protein